jgi:putative transposase
LLNEAHTAQKPPAGRFRMLNIVDDVTRECPAAIPDTSISGRRIARAD